MTHGGYREDELSISTAHGFVRMRYVEWGAPGNDRVVICVHGLTRNGRDFDALARALPDFRVICPDIPGRGRSDWLRDPHDYNFITYVGALTALVARAGVTKVSWVGTSMGGLLGIAMAGQRGSPVSRLVVNDIGPFIEPVAMERLKTYVGADPKFGSYEALEQYIRQISATFGPLTDGQWRHLAGTTARQLDDGRWGLRYDPGIAVPFRSAADQSPALWAMWDRIACPTLLLRGALSDLLSQPTAASMVARGPKPALIEFAGIGHAPMMLDDDQIEPVARFLRG